MPAETPASRPRPVPALHRRLLLPVLLLAALAALQWQLERWRAADRELLDFVDAQATLAARAAPEVERVASGGRQALDALGGTLMAGALAVESFHEAAEAEPAQAAMVGLLRERWAALQTAMQGLEARESLGDNAAQYARRVDRLGALLLLRGDELLGVMAEAEEPANRMRAAGRQLVLAQRMTEAARQALRGEADVLVMADRLGRDAVIFGEVNNALLNGERRLGLSRVDSDAAHDVLRAIGSLYRDLATLVEEVVHEAVALYEARDADDDARRALTALQAVLADARQARLALAAQREPGWLLRDVLAALLSVSLLGVALNLLRERRLLGSELLSRLAKARTAEETCAALQTHHEALSEARGSYATALRETLTAVREGNLGARCEPPANSRTAAVNGALDDQRDVVTALNQTLDELAERLGEARRTSRDVKRAVEEAREAVRQSHDLAGEQVTALAEARPGATQEAVSLDGQAAEMSKLAQQARETAERGAEASGRAQATCTDAQAAQEQLHAALRRTAGVVERGHELRDVVRGLDDLADECRILALNAAIHASMARGGQGGDDALAQAVQRLADGMAVAERRAGALADLLERSGEECLAGLRRAGASLADSLQRAGFAAEAGVEAAGAMQQLAERSAAHAAGMAVLASGATRRQSAVLRVEQLSAVLQQAAADSDRQMQRAFELVALLNGHLAALRLPTHDDANVVDLRDFLKRS